MAQFLVHYNGREENRNENGVHGVIVEAADGPAAIVAARSAMPPGGRTDNWVAVLMSAIILPAMIEGKLCPPAIRRGS